MAHWKFETELMRPEGVGTWTLAPIPPEIAKDGGLKARARVRGKIDDEPFEGSVVAYDKGRIALVVKDELRARLRKESRNLVSVELSLDSRPPAVELPKDFGDALAKNPKAKLKFDKMPPSHQREYADWVGSAKKQETRAKRIAEALEMTEAQTTG